MNDQRYYDVVICGGSLGGVLAAYSCAKSGKHSVILEETDWIGGQLTSQAVPPDEHKWIETTGCTSTYRAYRNAVRDHYRNDPAFSPAVKNQKYFCPAKSEVSYVSHPPKLALDLLYKMLAPYIESGLICIELNARLNSCNAFNDKIHSVTYCLNGETVTFCAEIFIDGTDTGELIALSGTKYTVGAESRHETGEKHAPETADPSDMQAAVFTAALENRIKGDFVIPKPPEYDYFSRLIQPYDKYKVFSMFGPDSSTGKAKQFGMFDGESVDGSELFPLFCYRRIIHSDYFSDGSHPYDVTLLNWPQNDYFLGNLFDCPDAKENTRLARQFTLSFVYWLQTEAVRPDGGIGYRYFHLTGEPLGTSDGLTKSPYIRESRRIRSQFTVTENMIAKGGNPKFFDSVGVGSYPIDLHITTKTNTFLYCESERFTIPLGALIPVRVKNLIPASKNIGTTHLTNGCYRLHPVEWNVGEAAGFLASFAIQNHVETAQIRNEQPLLKEFQRLLIDNGVQLYWE